LSHPFHHGGNKKWGKNGEEKCIKNLLIIIFPPSRPTLLRGRLSPPGDEDPRLRFFFVLIDFSSHLEYSYPGCRTRQAIKSSKTFSIDKATLNLQFVPSFPRGGNKKGGKNGAKECVKFLLSLRGCINSFPLPGLRKEGKNKEG